MKIIGVFSPPSQLASDKANMSRKITRWSTEAGQSGKSQHRLPGDGLVSLNPLETVQVALLPPRKTV